MDIETLRNYCLSKPETNESFPFDEKTLVFKLFNKMYALIGLERMPLSINLKCDPERAIVLREEHDGIIMPGYHMNKKHWNTVYTETGISDELLIELVDSSYNLVAKGLKKSERIALGLE